MRSITERQFVNGKKYTQAELDEQKLRVRFIKAKYDAAHRFFFVIWSLNLCDRARKWRPPYMWSYYANRLTQRMLYGKFDPNQPERGSRIPDGNDKTNIPAWFREQDRLGSR